MDGEGNVARSSTHAVPSTAARSWRRRIGAPAIALTLSLCVQTVADADEVSVPVELQIALLDRVLRYETRFAGESSPVHVLVVRRDGSAESARVTTQLVAELNRTGRLGGRTLEVDPVTYTSPSSLRGEVDAAHARIVYLSAGLADVVPAIGASDVGDGVITVSAVGAYVELGAVLGFELHSSRPRIAVNLGSSRDRGLRFDPRFLRLARVVE